MTTPTAPQGTITRYTVNLDAELRRRVKIAAVEDDVHVSDVVRVLLEEWLHDRGAGIKALQDEAPNEDADTNPMPVAAEHKWAHLIDPRAIVFLADAEARRARLAGLPTAPPKPIRG